MTGRPTRPALSGRLVDSVVVFDAAVEAVAQHIDADALPDPFTLTAEDWLCLTIGRMIADHARRLKGLT